MLDFFFKISLRLKTDDSIFSSFLIPCDYLIPVQSSAIRFHILPFVFIPRLSSDFNSQWPHEKERLRRSRRLSSSDLRLPREKTSSESPTFMPPLTIPSFTSLIFPERLV